MTLPEIINELEVLNKRIGSIHRRIKALVSEMPRRKPTRIGKRVSVRVTPAVIKAIKHTAEQNPDWTYTKIADLHGVNIGRVSETLRGKRK